MLEFEKVNYKFVILGAGPVGLYAGIRLGLLGQNVLLIEAKDEVGGQCTALYKEKPIYDLPGIKETNAENFINNLLDQFCTFEHEIMLSSKVTNISQTLNNIFMLDVEKKNPIFAEHIILACGGGFYSPINIGLPVSTELSRNIHYSIENSKVLSQKKIAIFGGGDSAIDWALTLSNISEHITLVHRGKSFRGSESNVQRITSNKNISVLLQSTLSSITRINNKIKLNLQKNNEDISILVDDVLVFFGLKMENTISSFNISPNMKNGRIIVSPLTLESSIKKLYAIGDISSYEFKKNNLTTGFGQCVQLVEYLSKNYF